ncbi:MAG: CHAT domain-containing protein [Bacteroidia bacterium]
MKAKFGLAFGLSLLFAQGFLNEPLYFQGKLGSFAKKSASAYKSLLKKGLRPEEAHGAVGVAQALALAEAHQYALAESLLQQFSFIPRGEATPELRLRYFWTRARILRGLGRLKESEEMLRQAQPYTQQPWEKALLNLEQAENALHLGQLSAAQTYLNTSSGLESFPPPYGGYLKARAAYLGYWLAWERGYWDSLPAAFPPFPPSNHLRRYQSEYAYLLAEAAFFQGDRQKARKYLSQSRRFARRTFQKGRDLALRARTRLLLDEFQHASRRSYERRLRKMNSIIGAYKARKVPLTYPAIEGLEHVGYITRLTRRENLYENLLSLSLQGAQGLLLLRLQRQVAAVGRLRGRQSIALGYATQSVLRAEEFLPTPALDQALSLAELGTTYLAFFRPQQADSAYAQVRRLLSALGDPVGPRTFSLWEVLAQHTLRRGYYSQAETLLIYQKTAYERLLPKPQTNPAYLRTALALANVSLALLLPAPAETLLLAIDKPIRHLPDAYLSEKITLEEALGDLARLKGQFREAERHYLRATRLRSLQRRESKETTEEGLSLLRLAILYQKTGRYTQAKETYNRLAKLYQGAREDAEAAAYYSALSEFYLEMGDYPKAEETIRKALDLNKRLLGPTSLGYVEAVLAAGRLAAALGRYDRQAAYLQEALQAQQSFYGSKPALPLARTHYLLAENALLQGKRDSATHHLHRSASIAELAQNSAPLEYAALSLDLSGAWLALDSLARAEERLAAARAILEVDAPAYHPDRLRAFLYQARLYRAQGYHLTALREYRKWLDLWLKAHGTQHPEYPFYLAELADLHWLAQSYADAKSNYKKAASLILKQVDKLFNGFSESEKARYWARVRRVLEHYYAYAFSQGTKSDRLQAYETYLATKAFILNETAQLRARFASHPDTLVQHTFYAWQEQKEFVARLYAYSPEELRTMGINLAEEEARLNELERQLAQYAGDIRLFQAKWRQLRQALPADAAAVDWLRLRSPLAPDSILYYAIITTRQAKEPLVVCFPRGRWMETYAFFRYSQSILNFEKDTISYRAFWAPVAEVLPPTVQKLFVSADGVYNQVNLSTLPLPTGGYLADKYQVIYHTRLANLLRPAPPIRNWEGRKALILANPTFAPDMPEDSVYVPPLPGTAEEAKAIQDILRSEGILPLIHLERQASEPLLYQYTSPYILHIATHGLFLPYDERLGALVGIQVSSALANPLFRSALLLAESGRSMLHGSSDVSRDGIANAYELISLRLQNTELVALSACETGLGEVQNGEGVYGLQRAFLIAGARNLLLSLWKVDDEATRDFMIRFYQEWLRKKLPLEEAFWNTQKAMREQRSAPYFWGAFILVRP